MLSSQPRTSSPDPGAQALSQHSPAGAKIALFRSLFRGREGVYPRRFESRKTGRSGYAPACANEWVPGICEKPRIKCAMCPHRRFLPVTDEVIRWHLSGRDAGDQPFVAGAYPLLFDETCFFLAVDFDKEGWQVDSIAFLRGCRRLGLTAALERSRSGRGGHAWLFFEQAVPAALARRLGSHLLTEAMEDRPDIGLDSYDRLFPNQDTMPQGGFGNLIALPLQRGPRDQGNSVFVDDDFVPWPDQWAFLASVRRLGRIEVEAIVQEAERRGRVLGVRLPPQDDEDVEPWTAPPSRRRQEAAIVGELPDTLELVYANRIYIAKDGLNPGLRSLVRQTMSAIGSFEVLTRTRFDDCLKVARDGRRETRGRWIFQKTQVTGVEGFPTLWSASVLERVDFEYSGYVLGNYLDAQYEINGLRLFDEQSETAIALAQVFTAAFVFDTRRTLPELPDTKLQAYARDEYGEDWEDLIEPIRAAHQFYLKGMSAITPDNLVVFVIR